MPRGNLHDQVMRAYMLHTLLRDSALAAEKVNLHSLCQQLETDIETFKLIRNTRYLNPRTKVEKLGNLHLAWEYAKDPKDHGRFQHMLRVSPFVFQVVLELMKDHPVFHNNSNVPQAPVDFQLAVTLFRMGRYGNAASLEDIAREAGISEGSVELYTQRCFEAIESLHDIFVRPLTAAEKEAEKVWMDERVGFKGLWREGWVMYDGTIVVLYAKPGLNGHGYYTRKGNYGLNLQVGNVPSTLRIVDYSHGFTGSAHDAAAFEHTAAFKYPDWFFDGEEFCWADSAYTLDSRTISVHKKPAALRPENIFFDKMVAHIRIRSEHCMGAIKGRFQCLRGLRVNIDSAKDHIEACRWITIAIILHNLVIDVEGPVSAVAFVDEHTSAHEQEDVGVGEGADHVDIPGSGEEKRQRLTAELIASHGL